MFLRRLVLAVMVCTCLVFVSCSTEQNVEVDQRAAFESYLKGQNVNYTIQNGVYKYIPNEQREDRASSAEVSHGDSVYFDYVISGFSSSTGTGGLYYTNIEALIAQDTVLNSEYWSKVPYGIKLGSTSLLRGVDQGLAGCRQGDSVLLFLISDLGYGENNVGLVPSDTPLVWTMKITKVIK